MDFSSLFSEELVAIGLTSANSEEALTTLTHSMVCAGYVRPEYVLSVIDRERRFPTGLPTAPIPVALAHGEPEYVLKSGVAVGTLGRPVKFHEMGAPSNVLDVCIVFVLAIREVEKQTKALQNFMGIIKNQRLMQKLRNADRREVITQLLRDGSKEATV